MSNTARLISETEKKLEQHLSFKGSFLAGQNWESERNFLEDQLYKFRIAFYDERILELEEKKALLIKNREKVTA